MFLPLSRRSVGPSGAACSSLASPGSPFPRCSSCCSALARHRQEPLGKDEAIGAPAGLAARRREDQLWGDATGQRAWIIILMLASAVLQATATSIQSHRLWAACTGCS